MIDVRGGFPRITDELATFWTRVWHATYDPILGIETTNTMNSILLADNARALLPGTGEVLYVARHSGVLTGTAIVRQVARTGYLWGMYVLPERQRCGIGSALLAAVADDRETLAKIEVRVLRKSPTAIAFYRKLGFAEIGEEDFQVTDDLCESAAVMSLSCPQHLPEENVGAAHRQGSSA